MSAVVFDGKTTVEHAWAASDAVRAINHLTFHDAGLPFPSDAYSVLGALGEMAERLPQALEQLAERLRGWVTASEIGIDPGTEHADEPEVAVELACEWLLSDARPAAGRLRAALQAAQRAIAYAHYTGALADHEQSGEARP